MGRGRTAIMVTIGGTLEGDAAVFLDAFERAERGEAILKSCHVDTSGKERYPPVCARPT